MSDEFKPSNNYDVVDLAAERDKRDGPDQQFITTDQFGRKMFCFGVDFEFDGREFSFHIWAYDKDDAAARVVKIRETATLAGQIMTVVPA